jgi:CRISPR system Cascade subunit CasC
MGARLLRESETKKEGLMPMSEFIQLHLLTSYPPSNLNRDDLGRPKTAVFGGTERLRVSSQSLKRAWRTAPLFEHSLTGKLGIRTRSIEEYVIAQLGEIPEAKEVASKMAGQFKKAEKKQKGKKQQTNAAEGDGAASEKGTALAFLHASEKAAIDALLERIRSGQKLDEADFQSVRRNQNDESASPHRLEPSADVALFGRMMAGRPDSEVDAAAQVAHAITVHRVAVEDDYFTAVDELNQREEDSGAGHLGVNEFAAGLFYLYVCINRDLLLRNLDGDESLADMAIRAVAEAAATVSPSGKQNSFASLAAASFILAERGDRQPRNLSVAFLEAVNGREYLTTSIQALRETCTRFDKVYGERARQRYELVEPEGKGTLAGLLDFVSGGPR